MTSDFHSEWYLPSQGGTDEKTEDECQLSAPTDLVDILTWPCVHLPKAIAIRRHQTPICFPLAAPAHSDREIAANSIAAVPAAIFQCQRGNWWAH